MPIANDMKNIAEGIEVSYGERMSWLANATKDTHQMMNRIHGENKEAAEGVARLLSEFRKEQKELVSELAQFLSLSEKQRLEDFHLMDEEIKKSVADVRSETKAIIERFRREIDEIGAEVANLLSRFRKEHGEMSAELRRKLTREEAERLEEFKPWFSDIQSGVRESLTATREDIKDAHAHWQNLARIMAAKRAGKAVTPAKKIEGVAKKEVAEAVEAFNAGSVKEQILRLVSETASGMSLAKMGTALRIPYIRLAKPANELVNEGKIKKEDLQYFKV